MGPQHRSGCHSPAVYISIRRARKALRWEDALGRAELALFSLLEKHEDQAEDSHDAFEHPGISADDLAKKKKTYIRRKAKDALIEKLGDITFCTPRELSLRIQQTYTVLIVSVMGRCQAKS